jgi:hypothetical protein
MVNRSTAYLLVGRSSPTCARLECGRSWQPQTKMGPVPLRQPSSPTGRSATYLRGNCAGHGIPYVRFVLCQSAQCWSHSQRFPAQPAMRRWQGACDACREEVDSETLPARGRPQSRPRARSCASVQPCPSLANMVSPFYGAKNSVKQKL